MNKEIQHNKRRYERVPVNEGICFFDNSCRHFGRLLDCSAEGMFIESQVSFPLNPRLHIVIFTGEELLNVPVQIMRIYKKNGAGKGLGVKILRNSEEYLRFVIK
jgi:hypothetical protein